MGKPLTAYEWLQQNYPGLTLEGLGQLPPEQQWHIANQLHEWQLQKQTEEAHKIDEANKPNTATQNAVGAVAGPAATIGGYYAANSLFSSSAAGAAGAGAGAGAGAAGAGAGAAGAGAGAGAGAAAGSVPAAPSVVAVNTVPASGSALGTAAAYAWPALAAYGAYRAYDKTSQNLKESDGGPLTDSEIYYQFQPTGLAALGDTLTGGYRSRLHNIGISPIGPMSLVIRDWLGSSKEENQIYRDRVRKNLKKRGFLNDNYEITTPGGAFNIGIEDPFGGDKPKFAGEHRYDVDVNSLDKAGNNLYGIADALANAGIMGDEKRRQQFAGYFMNAANVGGDAFQNMQSIAQQLGLTYEQAMTNLNQRTDLSPEQRAQYQNGINMLFRQDKYQDQNFFNEANGGQTAASSSSTPGAKPTSPPAASTAPVSEQERKGNELVQALGQMANQGKAPAQTFGNGQGITKGGGYLIAGNPTSPQIRPRDPGFNGQMPQNWQQNIQNSATGNISSPATLAAPPAPRPGNMPGAATAPALIGANQNVPQQSGRSGRVAGRDISMLALAEALHRGQWDQAQHKWTPNQFVQPQFAPAPQQPAPQQMAPQWRMLPPR